MIWHNEQVINPNLIFYDIIFTILLGLNVYCAGVWIFHVDLS